MIPTAQSINEKLRRGTLEFCVLAFLTRGPSYGLELAESLSSMPQLFGSEGTLYPLLARLRKQGWVESIWQESTAGPPRRYYSLTTDGLAALQAFTDAWTPFRDDVDSTLEGLQK